MSKVAIIIKTTPNRRSLLWLINSVELSLTEVKYRFYIADEEPLNEWKRVLYKRLTNEGHYVHIFNKQVSVTKARNFLLDNLQDENFVLRVDDDFELGGEFSINNLLSILKIDEIDFCSDVERQIGNGKNIKSGSLRIKSGKLILKSNESPLRLLESDYNWDYEVFDGVRYAKADFMRNLILLKRKCFEKVKWDEEIFFEGEHIDFYLSLKEAGFQGAFTPDSIHYHRDDLKKLTVDIKSESVERKLNKESIKNSYFKKKWNGFPKTSKNSSFKDVLNKFIKKLFKYDYF